MDPVFLLSIVFYRTFLNLLRGMDTFIFCEQKILELEETKLECDRIFICSDPEGKYFSMRFDRLKNLEKWLLLIYMMRY